MHDDPHGDDQPGHAGSAGLHHDIGDHGDDGGHDDHAHVEEPLGPIDLAAWGAGLLGVAVAAVMIVCFALATGALGGAA